MTPQQKLKWAILFKVKELDDDFALPTSFNESDIDLIYDDTDPDILQDAIEEVRCSGEQTPLECDWSRHYESKAVAAKMPDGTWVGWTYWYGGGKHGEPEEMDWIPDAYDVNCVEEEKKVIVKTFSMSETENKQP